MNSLLRKSSTKRPALSKYRLGPRKQQHRQVLAKLLLEVQPTPIDWDSLLAYSAILVIACVLMIGVVRLFLL